MSLFDPAVVNKQIDAYIGTIPPGKTVVILGHGSLEKRQVSLGVAVRLGDVFTGYARVTKGPQGTETEAGVRATFLVNPFEEEFSYSELVAILKDRGQGWIRAHMNAWRLMGGWEVEL